MRKYITECIAAAVVLFVFAMNCSEEKKPTAPLPGIPISLAGIYYTPQYIWRVGPVTEITVATVAKGDTPSVVVWGARTPGLDSLKTPVTHGIAPTYAGKADTADIFASTPPDTLKAGFTYTVTVKKLNGQYGILIFKR
jgi:hypothetical protein